MPSRTRTCTLRIELVVGESFSQDEGTSTSTMLKNLFRRKSFTPLPLPEPAPTLKARVFEFWEWYRGVAKRFYSELENIRGAGLQPEVSAKIDELLPGLGWVFGSGEGCRGHSFTLTPEGDPDKRFIAQYWLQQAPALENWTFYASRQPSDLHTGEHLIEIDGMKFAANAIWLVPRENGAQKKVDIMVWHPLFDRVLERLVPVRGRSEPGFA